MKRQHLFSILTFFAACGSPSSMMQGDDTPTPDAAVTPDAPAPDAPPPLQGAPCPTSIHEVGRITGANIRPDDRGFYGPTYRQGLYTRDADGDGKADVLDVEYVSSTSTTYTYRIRLWRRTATGFSTPSASDVLIPTYGPEYNAVGDVNGDHLTDVIFGYSTESPSRAPYIYVALQQPDHSFVLNTRVGVSACSSSSDERLFALGIVDVDHDGKDDVLATVSYGGLGASPAGLTLLRGGTTGLGSATCVASLSVFTAGYPTQLQSAERFLVDDYDGDGNVDLVATISGKFRYYRGTGPSAFAPVSGDVTAPTWRVTFANHVTGRAHQDLVNADIKSTGTKINRFTVDPTTGVAGGEVASLGETDPGGYGNVRGVFAGDLNGDKLSDVFEVGNQSMDTSSTTPSTFSVTCDRTAKWETATGSFPAAVRNLRPIDFDGDGRTEILAQVDADVVIYALQ